MQLLGMWATPGVGVDYQTYETELLWGADQARNGVLWSSAVVSGTTLDAGDTPTTILRPGLILGMITSSGFLKDFNSASTDGSQAVAGVLDLTLMSQDFLGNNQNRVIRVLRSRAPLRSAALLIQGAALIGHADEFLVRRQLCRSECVLDDDPNNYLSGLNQRTVAITATTYTVLTSDNGTIFTNGGAGGNVAFTLPAVQKGLEYTFFSEAAGTLTVSGAAGKLVTFNNAAATSVALSTATQIIGGQFRVKSNFAGTKWLVETDVNPGATVTVA